MAQQYERYGTDLMVEMERIDQIYRVATVLYLHTTYLDCYRLFTFSCDGLLGRLVLSFSGIPGLVASLPSGVTLALCKTGLAILSTCIQCVSTYISHN